MSFTLPGDDLADGDFADPTAIDEKFAAIETLLNGNLKDENVDASAEIDARKIGNGGAVTEGDVTDTGEAKKIPQFDANGNLVVTRIIFKEA